MSLSNHLNHIIIITTIWKYSQVRSGCFCYCYLSLISQLSSPSQQLRPIPQHSDPPEAKITSLNLSDKLIFQNHISFILKLSLTPWEHGRMANIRTNPKSQSRNLNKRKWENEQRFRPVTFPYNYKKCFNQSGPWNTKKYFWLSLLQK